MTLCATSSRWIEDLRARSHATGENRQASLDGHRRILEAIRARDAAAAEAAMRDHIMVVGFLD
jgi:GntR family transcriptional repressor for pyruvate dehydrogenase complex